MTDGTWFHGDDCPCHCAGCGGTELVVLGRLGRKLWTRCRDCGYDNDC